MRMLMNKRNHLAIPAINLAVLLGIMFFYPLPAVAQVRVNKMTVTSCPGCTTGLPKTGQQNCYDSSSVEISCSGSGQDAEYADPAGSYDIGYTRGSGSWANWNADGGRFTKTSGSPPSSGTVLDNATGLEWIANPSDASMGGEYSWANALTACEGLSYAGKTDWRLPNINELLSLLHFKLSTYAIDTNFFTVALFSSHWSSTSYKNDLTSAWMVDFYNGENMVSSKGDSSLRYARCVRGGR